MNKEQFYTYLESTNLLDDKTLRGVEEILAEYPYFQTAHLLYLKNLHAVGHLKFNKQLRISSCFVADRKHLHQFLFPDLSRIKETVPEVEALSDEIKPVHHLAVESEDENGVEAGVDPQQPLGETVELADGEDLVTRPVPAEKAPVVSEKLQDEEEDKDQEDPFERKWLGEDLLKKINEETAPGLEEKEESLFDIPSQQVELGRTAIIGDYFADVPDAIPEEFMRKKEPTKDEVKKNEKHSFDEWLSLIADGNSVSKPGDNDVHEKSNGKARKKRTIGNQHSLIDDFIKANPKIEPPKDRNVKNEDISKASVSEDEDLITDTLAKIYISQKHYAKAILAYEKLSLKYPEKKLYFASQIRKIKELKNK